MRTWYFEDMVSGEEFFVEAISKEWAETIALTYFEQPQLHGEVSEEFAEWMGFDTY